MTATGETPSALKGLFEQGYVIVPELFNKDEAAQLRDEVWEQFPAPASYFTRHANPDSSRRVGGAVG